MGVMAKIAWTPERIKELTALIAEGKSFTEIARFFNTSNRVISAIRLRKIKGVIKRKCADCKRRFPRGKGKRIYCDWCRAKYKKLARDRESTSPAAIARRKVWHDKKSYGLQREVIIKRDGEKCAWCLMAREKHLKLFKADLFVVHLNGQGRKKGPDNRLENLLTLCLSCEGKHGATFRNKNWKVQGEFLRSMHRLVKSNCVSCGTALPHLVPRYFLQGNYCSKCEEDFEQRARDLIISIDSESSEYVLE